MTQFYAQPYDISANGFYFSSIEEYQQKAAANRNDYGDEVEEYEIQFIDGDDFDCELFNAFGVHQGDIGAYFKACDEWEDHQKLHVIIAVGECGYSFDLAKDDPDNLEVDLYDGDSLKELAEQFVDEGHYGEIPANISFYLDYDKMARDLSVDYTETRINGVNYVYRCN